MIRRAPSPQLVHSTHNMADSLQLVEKLDREFLECGICLDRYTKPRGLPCLHSFCHDCLEKYCKGKRRILCPNCKKATTVPKKGVAGFPPHFMVNSLQETVYMERLKIGAEKCSNCDEKNSTVRCLVCKETLCDTCHSSHNKWKRFKQHKVVNIQDAPSGDALSESEKALNQACGDHDGETKRFYCETCEKLICRDCVVMKQHCRDHDYMTLKEASEKYASTLDDLRGQGEDLKEKWHDAIQKTESIKKSLEDSFNEAVATLESVEREYKEQVEAIVTKHRTHVNELREKRLNMLSETSEKLQESLIVTNNACDFASNVTQAASDYDITSAFATLSSILKKCKDVEAASPVLGYIKVEGTDEINVPNVVKVVDSEKWKQVGQFSTNDFEPWALTIHPDGSIAVTGWDGGITKGFQVFSASGQVKHSIFRKGLSNFFVGDLLDIAITPDKRYIVPGIAEILFFDDCGNILEYTASTSDMNNKPADPWRLSVDQKGRIIAGIGGTTISIHQTEGEFISKFPLPLAPCSHFSLATTSSGHIAVAAATSRGDQSFMILDYLGNTFREIQPPHSSWNPQAMSCSKQGDIFIRHGWKEVHRYDKDVAHCLGCIVSGLDQPMYMAVSDNGQRLFVVENNQRIVKIFQKP